MSSRSEEHTPEFKSKKENIRAIKFLGGGSFGNVFEIEEETSEFSQPLSFAVKQISVEKYKFYFQNEVTPFSKLLREVHLLKKLGATGSSQDSSQGQNPTEFVVKLYDDWVEGKHAGNEEELDKSFKTANPDFSSGQTPPPTKNWLFIKMELCHLTLDDWLKRDKIQGYASTFNFPSPSQHLKIIHQLLQALSLIHNHPPKGVVHRDIKPANIFLNCSTAGDITMKLGDFGLGRVLREDKSRVSTVALGTARYKSPEMLKEDGYYDTKTDVFSMGLVFLEIIVNYEGGIYGETTPKEVQRILNNLFYRLQVGKLSNLVDEFSSEVLNLEIEIVNRMTAFDKDERFTAGIALGYLENLDKFSALLAKERKEARLIFYNVPPPTTFVLRGRTEQVQDLENFLQHEPSTSIMWLSGPMSIGVTEFASYCARKSKGEMHIVWLDYQSISTSLKTLVSFLGIEFNNLDFDNSHDQIDLTLLKLVITDLRRRDSTVPILFIFHDIFYTIEASELVEKLLNSDNNRLLKFILVTKFNPPDSLESVSSKIIKLEALDLYSSTLLVKDWLSTLNLDLDKHSTNIEEVAKLTFNIPGFIRRLCDYINSLLLTSDPISLNEAITFLKYDMRTLLKFKGGRRKSFQSQWQDIKERYVDLEDWEYKILQVLSFAFPRGKGDTSILSEICNKTLGLQLEEEMDFDKFQYNVSEFNICSVIVDRGSYSGQSLEIYPLLNEIIKMEFISAEKEEFGNVLVQLLDLAKKSGGIDEFGGMPEILFRTLWEWLAKEDDLRVKYVQEFIEFTINLGGSWELPPLNEDSNRFACRAWAQDKFRQLQQDLISGGHGEENLAIITIKCYEIVYNVYNDISRSIKPFITLRNFLIEKKEKIEKSNNNLSKFLLEHCCPLVSKFVFEQGSTISQSDKDLIKYWILLEINEIDDCIRDVDFVIFSFLPILRADEYKTILEIGEMVISHWFKYQDIHQPNQIIVVVIFLCIMISMSLRGIPEMDELLNKLEAIVKFNFPSVSQGLFLWKLWLFDKWPKWFASSLFISGNKLDLILNLLLLIFIKSHNTQQEFFEELRGTYVKFLENSKGRVQDINGLRKRYIKILQEMVEQTNELFEAGIIPRFYRNYVKSEVNQCCALANLKLEGSIDSSAYSSLDIYTKNVDDWTPFFIGLAMYGNHPELDEMLDKIVKKNGENGVIIINENGYFIWDPNLTNLPNSNQLTTLGHVKLCLEQTGELIMPQIMENFSPIYPHLGGGVLVHLFLSPITVPYRGQLLHNFLTHAKDKATLKSVVHLLAEMLQLGSHIYEIETLFDLSIGIVAHVLTCGTEDEENFGLATHLLKTLIREFSTHYEGRGRLVSLGENFLSAYPIGKISLRGVEIGIREACVGLMNQHWEKDCAIKCLNLLRALMKIRMKAKFSTPFATKENMVEQFDKILGYFNKIGIGDVGESSKFSVNLATIIFMLCLEKDLPGKEDDAVKVLGEIFKYYVEIEGFHEILYFRESIEFSGWRSTKFDSVREKACQLVQLEGGETLSFSKVEELLKRKLFTVKNDGNLELKRVGDEDGIVL